MATLLIINSSPRSNSVSRQLTARFAEDWKARNPGSRVIERDLSAAALPFVTESWIQASYTPEAKRSPEHVATLALSDTLVDELLQADVIALGVPMHNFSVPASLKAWIDLVVRAGKTFSYGETGPKGLIPSDKKVIVIGTRGGPYMPNGAMDFQAPYLKHMLGFIGLTNVSFIHVDKQGMGDEVAKQAVDRAVQELSAEAELCASPVAVAA